MAAQKKERFFWNQLFKRTDATYLRIPAPRMEGASFRRMDGTGNFPFQKNALPFLLLVVGGSRHRRKQCLRIGMNRVGINLAGVHNLHNVTQIHHADHIGNIAYNSQIMGDEDVSKTQLFLQRFEQIDHLRLNGNIQGGNRLVADDQFRIACQRAGNPQALTLRHSC